MERTIQLARTNRKREHRFNVFYDPTVNKLEIGAILSGESDSVDVSQDYILEEPAKLRETLSQMSPERIRALGSAYYKYDSALRRPDKTALPRMAKYDSGYEMLTQTYKSSIGLIHSHPPTESSFTTNDFFSIDDVVVMLGNKFARIAGMIGGRNTLHILMASNETADWFDLRNPMDKRQLEIALTAYRDSHYDYGVLKQIATHTGCGLYYSNNLSPQLQRVK